jgi:hypothetical protein
MNPHGVPGGAMPRVLSNVKLEEQEAAAQAEQYGANLGLPGGKKGSRRHDLVKMIITYCTQIV